MKANELRVGNFVFEPLNENKKAFKVFEIYHEEDYDKINYYNALNFEPIPLTKEWLLKLGFKKRFDFDDCNLYDLVEYTGITKSGLNRGQGFFCLADFIEKEGFWIDLQSRATLKYVHQLQNLFSAITGIELQLSST